MELEECLNEVAFSALHFLGVLRRKTLLGPTWLRCRCCRWREPPNYQIRCLFTSAARPSLLLRPWLNHAGVVPVSVSSSAIYSCITLPRTVARLCGGRLFLMFFEPERSTSTFRVYAITPYPSACAPTTVPYYQPMTWEGRTLNQHLHSSFVLSDNQQHSISCNLIMIRLPLTLLATNSKMMVHFPTSTSSKIQTTHRIWSDKPMTLFLIP